MKTNLFLIIGQDIGWVFVATVAPTEENDSEFHLVYVYSLDEVVYVYSHRT